jgi:hypothetical protein
MPGLVKEASMKVTAVGAILGLFALTACVGRTLDNASDDTGADTKAASSDRTSDGGSGSARSTEAAADEPADANAVDAATGPEAFTPAQVAAARTACARPHGALVSPSTVGDLRTLLTGSWFLCSTEMTYAGVDYESMVYDADGQWANLLTDAEGGLVRGVGIDSVGTYTISDNPEAGEGDPVRTGGPVYMAYPTGSFNAYFVSFETDPQRMNVVIGTADTTEWFIRLPAP